MPYRLLVLDLDGTLMGPDLVISNVSKQAISRAMAHGVIVTVATGRVFNATLPFVRELGIDAPIICQQGALIRHPGSGETYDETGVHGTLAAEAVERLQRDGVFVIAFSDERTYATGPAPELDLYLSFHPGGEADVVIEPDLVRFVESSPPIKLLFAAEPEALDRQIASLSAHFTDRLSVVRSHVHFGEITAPGVTKGSALAALAARRGISSKEVIAIGDEENDLPMLAWAGLGLAMGNAPLSVRNLADGVLPSISEDGVAWAIETYLLDGRVRYCTSTSSTQWPEKSE